MGVWNCVSTNFLLSNFTIFKVTWYSTCCSLVLATLQEVSDLLTYLLTYLLTPWSRVLLEKLASLQLVKKFPAFDGTRRFLTALTSARHLSLSWASPIQFSYPNPTSWRSILILSSHLRLGHPSGLFPSGFPTSTLHTPLPSPIRATVVRTHFSEFVFQVVLLTSLTACFYGFVPPRKILSLFSGHMIKFKT